MKRLLLIYFLVPLFFACNNASSPKETAEQYVRALSSADLQTAASLTSANTKAVLAKAQKEKKNASNPEESFRFSALTESISSNNAEVKNELITVPLVKEDGSWKVVLNQALLNEIQNHDEMQAAAKLKWEALLKEYDARLQVLKQYIDYKKSMGVLSPKVSLLHEAMNKFAAQKDWTKESVLAYTEKQRQLNNLIDAAFEPALNANTDLSLNYILQVSAATDRIKAAENDYQSAAELAHSTVYVPLSFRQSTLVQKNRR